MSSTSLFLWNLVLSTENCSGHGIQVLVNNQTLLCQCDPWFTGGGDFFDTRVLPPFSLTCENSRVGEIVIWALVLFSLVKRISELIRSLYLRIDSYHFKKGYTWRRLFLEEKGFQFILFDTLVISLLALTCSILKIVGFILGTDIPATIIYLSVIVSHQLNQLFLGELEFRVLLSPIRNQEISSKLFRLKSRLDWMSFCIYMVVIIASIYCLFLDKSLGPISNNEYIIIIIRNVFAVLWSFAGGLSIWMISRQAAILLNSTNFETAKDTNKNTMKVNQILNSLRTETRKHAITLFIVSTMFATFLIPYLWSQQTYVLGFNLFVFGFRHVGKNFDREYENNKLKQQEDSVNVRPFTSSDQKIEKHAENRKI